MLLALKNQGDDMDAETSKQSSETCRTCGKDVSLTVANGETVCPFCGHSLLPPTEGGLSRGNLWFLFWAVFLGTPLLTFLSFRTSPLSGMTFTATGLLFAGGILSKLFVNSHIGRIVMTILFAFLLLVVYGGIFFVGCLVAMNGKGF